MVSLISVYINDLLRQYPKILIYIIPLIILCGSRSGGFNLGLLRQVKLVGCIFAFDIALANVWLRSLRNANLPGVFFAADEVFPETVAFANDVACRVGILVFVSEYGVEAAAAEKFVILSFRISVFSPFGIQWRFFFRRVTYDEPVIKCLLEARSIFLEIVDG